jgi:hypothetical protein
MLAEFTTANIAFDVAEIFLLRFGSFHVLIYASIVVRLRMVAESAVANLTLAVRYGFLFRSLSFGIKANGWCLALRSSNTEETIMATLTWKDSRLPANDVAPWDTTVMLVGPTTPLAEMVSDSVAWCKTQSGNALNLMIYCHGNPGSLLICKEGSTIGNVAKLGPLSPYFVLLGR